MTTSAKEGFKVMAAAVAVWWAGWLGVPLSASPSGWESLVWVPAGLSLSLFLWQGRRAVPGLLLGGGAWWAWTQFCEPETPWPAAAWDFVILLTVPVIPSLLLLRAEFRASLVRLSDVLLLTFVGALGCGFCATLALGLRALSLTSTLATLNPWVLLVQGMAVALGVLLVAPVTLVWGQNLKAGQVCWLEAVEVGALALIVTLAAAKLWQPFGPELMFGQTSVPLLVLPGLLWASTRYGQRGAVTALGALALWALLSGHAGLTTGINQVSVATLSSAQLSLCIAAMCVLVFGAIIEERRQAIRVRDDFLIIASHELKTPLTALMLGVENLERRLQKDFDPKNLAHIRKLGMCHQQVNRLARLVDGLLDVSRISNRRLSLQRQPADLASIVRSVVGEVLRHADSFQCPVRLELSDGTWGDWDCERMSQMVRALFDNACKYGAGHPIVVTLTTSTVGARLTVEDHGIGIAPGDTCRIFGRFERAVSAQYYGGMGLGLYVARKIARAHGGELWVHSRLGEGSAFTVELPRHQTVFARLAQMLRPMPRYNARMHVNS